MASRSPPASAIAAAGVAATASATSPAGSGGGVPIPSTPPRPSSAAGHRNSGTPRHGRRGSGNHGSRGSGNHGSGSHLGAPGAHASHPHPSANYNGGGIDRFGLTPPSPSMYGNDMPSPSVSRRRPSESEGAGLDLDLRPTAPNTGHMVTCHPHLLVPRTGHRYLPCRLCAAALVDRPHYACSMAPALGVSGEITPGGTLAAGRCDFGICLACYEDWRKDKEDGTYVPKTKEYQVIDEPLQGLYVLSKPSTRKGEAVERLRTGDQVTVYEQRDDGWLKVGAGWVKAKRGAQWYLVDVSVPLYRFASRRDQIFNFMLYSLIKYLAVMALIIGVALQHGSDQKSTWPTLASCERCVNASLTYPSAYFEFGYCDDRYYSVGETPTPKGHLLYKNPPEDFHLDDTSVSEINPAIIYSAVAFGMVAIAGFHSLWVAYDYPRRGPQTLMVHKVSRACFLCVGIIAFMCSYVWSVTDYVVDGCPSLAIDQKIRFARVWIFAAFCFCIVVGPVVMTRSPKCVRVKRWRIFRDVWASLEMTLLVAHLTLSIILAAEFTYHGGDLYAIIITCLCAGTFFEIPVVIYRTAFLDFFPLLGYIAQQCFGYLRMKDEEIRYPRAHMYPQQEMTPVAIPQHTRVLSVPPPVVTTQQNTINGHSKDGAAANGANGSGNGNDEATATQGGFRYSQPRWFSAGETYSRSYSSPSVTASHTAPSLASMFLPPISQSLSHNNIASLAAATSQSAGTSTSLSRGSITTSMSSPHIAGHAPSSASSSSSSSSSSSAASTVPSTFVSVTAPSSSSSPATTDAPIETSSISISVHSALPTNDSESKRSDPSPAPAPSS